MDKRMKIQLEVNDYAIPGQVNLVTEDGTILLDGDTDSSAFTIETSTLSLYFDNQASKQLRAFLNRHFAP